MRRWLILVLFLCVMVIPALATDHYVSTTGSATWSQCVNISAPCAASTAMTNAVAGDTTYFLSGIYYLTTSTSSRYRPALNPSNSGTSGNPIIFKSYIQYGAVITYAESISGTGGPLIGSYNKDYITWDGFTVQEVGSKSVSDTGPVVVFGLDANYATNVTIQNSEIIGEAITRQDNHPAVRIENAQYTYINNNIIRDIAGQGVYGWNHCLIQEYNGQYTIIEHNVLSNAAAGVYLKGGNGYLGIWGNKNNTVRYNIIHDVDYGIRASFTGLTNIYQNIIYNTSQGMQYAESCGNLACTGQGADFPGMENVSIDFYNNVIYNSYQGITFNSLADRTIGGGNDWRNNIVVLTSYTLNTDDYTNGGYYITFHHFESNYSNYYTAAGTNFRFTATNKNIAQWRTATTWASYPNGYDVNSIVTDPLFVDATGHNFHLQTGSPALNNGTDFGDLDLDGNTTEPINMGVYITGDEDIGLISGEEEPPNTNYFNSTWNTSAISEGSTNATSIHLPLVSTGTYDFVMNWGETIFFLKLFSIKISFWVWIILFVAIIVVTIISIQISTSKTLISPATPTPTPATSTTTSAITVLKKIPWTAVGIVLVIILIIVAVVYSIVLKF